MLAFAIDLEFCPACGTSLLIAFNGDTFLYCPKCDCTTELPKGTKLRVSSDLVKPLDAGIVILDRKALSYRTSPFVSASCPSCEGGKAEAWSLTVGSDGVSNITMYRCVSCGYTWRENDLG